MFKITNILFINNVISIVVYDLIPTFWQRFNAFSIKFGILRAKEVGECILDIPLAIEFFSTKKVLHAAKQMVVARRNIRAIRRVRKIRHPNSWIFAWWCLRRVAVRCLEEKGHPREKSLNIVVLLFDAELVVAALGKDWPWL